MFTAPRASDGVYRQVPFFLRRGKRGFFFGAGRCWGAPKGPRWCNRARWR